MAKLPKDWERRLVELAAIHGVTDFIARGRLTKAESKLFFGILRKLGPPAVRAGPRLGMTALRGAKFVTMRHPYIAAAVVTYEVVKNREQIAELAREGWEIVEPAVEPVTDFLREQVYTPENLQLAKDRGVIGAPPFLDPLRERFLGKPKKKSRYNRAMSAALKAVKSSTKGGKKGTISPVKSVFKTVSKVVSKINKGVKVSPLGISGIAAKAARKVLGKKKKTTKKTKKRGPTYTYRK
tara:strand:- start:725 stop:1441 length:717 start_codon:yes stop_codon:yes gene_type:complete